MTDNEAERVDRPPILTDDDAAILDHAIDPVAEPPALDNLPTVRYARPRVPSIPSIDRMTARTYRVQAGVPFMLCGADPWRRYVRVDIAGDWGSSGAIALAPTAADAMTGAAGAAGLYWPVQDDCELAYNGELWAILNVPDETASISVITISNRPTERN